MRGIITGAALAASLAFAGIAPVAVQAKAPPTHTCSGNNEYRVVASGYTSCPFAFNINIAWQEHHRRDNSSSGYVRSPVTHKRYLVNCYDEALNSRRDAGTIMCGAYPVFLTKSWVTFKTDGS